MFDEVFVLEVDLDTLNRRLDERPEDEFGTEGRRNGSSSFALPSDEGGPTDERVVIDATAPLEHVVDEILRRSEANKT